MELNITEGLKMKYFVLKPKAKTMNDDYAKASRKAMLTFASYIKEVNPTLAQDLEAWVAQEETI